MPFLNIARVLDCDSCLSSLCSHACQCHSANNCSLYIPCVHLCVACLILMWNSRSHY